MSSRDIVKFLPNERVDVGDAEAIQRNVLTDHRAQMKSLVFGSVVTASGLRRVVTPFVISPQGTPDATADISAGVAIAAELLPDSTREYGVIFGNEVQATQTLDWTGQPSGTYGVYVRYTNSPGKVGARVFWNSTSNDEDVDAVETRYVVDWDVSYSSGGSPGDEWVYVGDVFWDGGTPGEIETADITVDPHLMFEGDAGASYAQEWGDGANDRNADRVTHGAHDLYTWVQGVRRQLSDIIGGEWYTAITTSLNTHVADSTDPHGATLTQTNLEVTNLLDADGMALNESGVTTDGMACREIITPADIKAAHDQAQGWTGFGATAASSSSDAGDLVDSFDALNVFGLAFSTLVGGITTFVIPLRLEGAHPLGTVTQVDIVSVIYTVIVNRTAPNGLVSTGYVISQQQFGANAGDIAVLDTTAITIAATADGRQSVGSIAIPNVDLREYNYYVLLQIDDTAATGGSGLLVVQIEVDFEKAALHTVLKTF